MSSTAQRTSESRSLSSGRRASRSFFFAAASVAKLRSATADRAADGRLRILHQSEEVWQQDGAVLGAELAHDKYHGDAKIDARVGERGPAASRELIIETQDADDGWQCLHERGPDFRGGSGINVADFVGKVAQRVAAGRQRLQGFIAHQVGRIEQRHWR